MGQLSMEIRTLTGSVLIENQQVLAPLIDRIEADAMGLKHNLRRATTARYGRR